MAKTSQNIYQEVCCVPQATMSAMMHNKLHIKCSKEFLYCKFSWLTEGRLKTCSVHTNTTHTNNKHNTQTQHTHTNTQTTHTNTTNTNNTHKHKKHNKHKHNTHKCMHIHKHAHTQTQNRVRFTSECVRVWQVRDPKLAAIDNAVLAYAY